MQCNALFWMSLQFLLTSFPNAFPQVIAAHMAQQLRSLFTLTSVVGIVRSYRFTNQSPPIYKAKNVKIIWLDPIIRAVLRSKPQSDHKVEAAIPALFSP